MGRFHANAAVSSVVDSQWLPSILRALLWLPVHTTTTTTTTTAAAAAAAGFPAQDPEQRLQNLPAQTRASTLVPAPVLSWTCAGRGRWPFLHILSLSNAQDVNPDQHLKALSSEPKRDATKRLYKGVSVVSGQRKDVILLSNMVP